ncbi:protein SFI1 homolog isoform X3 [Corythoichthys intestinalis]|uniref:protein SFI1 homolog isoform X3 n=1 Tax=Corythoichthys intestinalis TaxID=161448 RepID=UPI0025A63CDA|nr:protein SFI1 homolog isoform X3 [Corythoichthys intestinalis]
MDKKSGGSDLQISAFRRFNVDSEGPTVQRSTVRCARIEELRIRLLARKFFKLWMLNTFGRILPHKAKIHHDNVLLRKTFEGWKEEWWTSGREWSLSFCAKYHYRYYLLYTTFQSWQMYTSLKVEKKSKIQKAQRFADNRRVRQFWDKWQLFIHKRRLKSRALQLARDQHRHTMLRSVWRLWQMRLQQHKNICTSKDQTLKHGGLNLQSEKEKESKASHHFGNRVEKKSLDEWQSFVSSRKHKKPLKDLAEHFARLHLMRMSWSVWRKEWHRKQSEKECLQSKELLSTQLKPTCTSGLLSSSANVTWHEEEAEGGQMHLRLWKDHFKEAEDERIKALTDMALKNYRKYLLGHCFDHWRRKLTQQRHTQELECRADIWFAEHFLARYFNLWCKYISHRRLKKERCHRADIYNKQRLCTCVLSTWRQRSNERKDEMLSLRIAILHEERGLVQRAWLRWRKRTVQQIGKVKEKQQASEHHYLQTLPNTSLARSKSKTTELHVRNKEQQVYSQGTLCRVTWALERWKKFVQRQKLVKSRQEQVQHCNENTIPKSLKLKDSFRTSELTERALWHWALTLQAKVLYRWWLWVTEQRSKKVEALKEAQVNKILLLKVFQAWREETMRAVFEKRKALNTTQSSVNQVTLLQKEQIGTEKARKHYNSILLRKVLRAWSKHHSTCIKFKAMKQQGILFLKRKMYQTYFARWRRKHQLKLKVSEQTEQALWHWALSLQAKVLYAWRLWVTEQHRRKTEALEALQMDKDKSQIADVTYSDDKNNTRSLPEPGVHQDDDPPSPRIQRVLKRVAMKWKQRALCKPLKKSVTFCFPETKHDSPSESEERDIDDSMLIRPLMRRQPRRCEELFEPLKAFPYDGNTTVAAHFFCTDRSSSLHHSSINFSATCQNIDVVNLPLQKGPVCIMEQPEPPSELLLPPSTFMSAESQLGCDSTFSPKTGPGLEPSSSTPSDVHPRESNGSSETDTTLSLLTELISIQQDMRSFQQERKQLRLWQRVKDVLQGWLQTSGKDEEMESNAVWQQVKELEERIERLSCELATRRLTMRFHVQRIQHLQSVLDCYGFSSLYRQVQMQT